MFLYSVLILSFCAQFGNAVYDNFTFDHIIATQTSQKHLWNETNQDKLKKDLLVNYDRYARPYEHFNVTIVKFGIVLLHLETNEKKSTVSVFTYIRSVWTDQKLKWNPEDYNNVTYIKIASHELWYPEIYLFNSVSGGESVFHFGAPHALAYSNGEILFVPPIKQTILCDFDLRYWPFDTQYCQLKYSSWTYHGAEIELEFYGDKNNIDLSDFQQYTPWNVTYTTGELITKKFVCCPQKFYYLVFNFTIVRNSDTYTAAVITPSVVNTIMVLVQFWLPPKSKQKLYLNGFILVVSSAYLMYFMDLLGGTAKSTPIILEFYASSLYVVCFGILINVITINICKSKKLIVIEMGARRIFSGRIAQMLLLNNDHVSFTNNPRRTSSNKEDDDEKTLCEYYNETACFLSVLLNRFLFLIYLLIIGIVIFTI